MKDAVLLDAGMNVKAALRRLAQQGFWKSFDVPEVRAWLEEYLTNIKLAARVGQARSEGSGNDGGEPVAVQPAFLTFEEAVRLNERPHAGQWAAIRRQDDATIFWYARPISDLLDVLSNAEPDIILGIALDLHESTSTPAIQVADLSERDGKLAVALQGNDLIGVKESTSSYLDVRTRGGGDLVRGDQQSVGEPPSTDSDVDETAGVVVRAFPLLQARQKVTVGMGFDLEIGLSEIPVVGVASTGQVVLRAPAGTTMIPVEIQVVADGFEAPQGWRQQLEVLVADPTKARVIFALVALPQNETVRLTSLLVHFVIGGVRCGTASRNVVVESTAGVARAPDPRGTSWLGAEDPPIAIPIGAPPSVPDIELDIVQPDGNAAQGNYQCVMRNAHGIPVPDAPLPIKLGSDASTFAKILIDQVRQFSGKPLVAILLRGIGEQVAEKLPPEFWTLLDKVAALVKKRPITFQLNSSEPYVPWELAVVDRPIDAARPKFLAAQVAMGRWIVSGGSVKSPPRNVRDVRAMAVMAGMYNAVGSGLTALPQAIEEAKAIVKSYGELPTIPLKCTEADFKELLDATLSYDYQSIGGVQCVHFAGHGDVDPGRPGDAAIYLSDGGPIHPLFFRSSALGKQHAPFIFLNACMVGTGGTMLGDFGGFPGNCLAGGFCGLVAPLWAVNDAVAKSVAIEFYEKMFASPEGQTVAEILQDVRSKYDDKKPVSSYLAYVYYGNPHLKFTRPKAGT